ncbi:MAG: L-serine ammonia-lyase, iron-sulfur-dependent, subunit alpha [Synergistaceae bacterium]|nr:L-serine ammonia-lyase, iron-sulfur-dependent, subunit alpha [Synergistaceae bacterium]
MLRYESIRELIDAARSSGGKIGPLVLEDQAKSMESDEDSLFRRMEESFDVMVAAAKRGREEGLQSMSGLTGGEGYKMARYAETGGLSGPFMTKAMSVALAAAGCNAAMGKIVAAPTAGSCGILPGCLVTLFEEKRAEKRDIVLSMFTAGAFGMVIARNACIAGAQGGCQAECGSAAGMAAAALVELMGGTPVQCGDACAIALANQLGLVCDPVAGLVEIPCVKRNAAGVMIAFSSADMALAGIEARIPVDECIAAMREVGGALPSSLKETAGGGLAATPTGRALREKVFGQGK